MSDRILVIGSGAREHAIAVTLLAGRTVDEVFCAPGNPGMALDGIHLADLDTRDSAAVVDYVHQHSIDWVFVGPEQPLIEGLVDKLTEAGVRAFGPTRAAAQIEGSKDFAKALMRRHGIPTAAYATFDRLEPAQQYVREHGAPIVVKADGLAAGKGVTVAMTLDQALDALEQVFVDRRFGQAGARVVIEDYMSGQECSLMCFVRGEQVWPMPLAQDHKPAYDKDKGPNTGGMGAYSPLPQFGDDLADMALETIVKPTVRAMVEEGTPFTGILYTGLMVTDQGPKVVEFNARMGDPETEVVLPLLTSDLALGIRTLMDGGEPTFTWRRDVSEICVVLAADGYPGHPDKGAPVPLVEPQEGLQAYYAGIDGSIQGGLTAASGRTAVIRASGPDLRQAQKRIYGLLDGLDTSGLFYRHDIGHKGLETL